MISNGFVFCISFLVFQLAGQWMSMANLWMCIPLRNWMITLYIILTDSGYIYLYTHDWGELTMVRTIHPPRNWDAQAVSMWTPGSPKVPIHSHFGRVHVHSQERFSIGQKPKAFLSLSPTYSIGVDHSSSWTSSGWTSIEIIRAGG